MIFVTEKDFHMFYNRTETSKQSCMRKQLKLAMNQSYIKLMVYVLPHNLKNWKGCNWVGRVQFWHIGLTWNMKTNYALTINFLSSYLSYDFIYMSTFNPKEPVKSSFFIWSIFIIKFLNLQTKGKGVQSLIPFQIAVLKQKVRYLSWKILKIDSNCFKSR